MKGILASGFFLKCAELMAQVLVVAGVAGEVIFAKLYFADITDVVCSFDHQVYLCSILFFSALPWA